MQQVQQMMELYIWLINKYKSYYVLLFQESPKFSGYLPCTDT